MAWRQGRNARHPDEHVEEVVRLGLRRERWISALGEGGARQTRRRWLTLRSPFLPACRTLCAALSRSPDMLLRFSRR